ncbi:cytosolic phospholipase A2 gamma-like [Labrus bergylta]|uniref:cytosolic phospholipase A2 gamma-like n=1 Tax=Labrus bergylta TaxID=56723 RepID=UPI0033135E84
MEEKRTAYEKSVLHSQCLCAGEHEYVLKRKRVVLQSLNCLGISCSEDSVPHIALLASGGGQRAAVALVGSLHQMEKDGLLDSVLYLGGVSGSTWSMASLYSDPQWSMGMDRAVSSLTSPGVELDEALSWLGERAKEEDFSLTDIWGVLTSAGIMKQMDLRLLSDEAGRKATNPYPIYCAIEKYFFSEGPLEATWFEMSPHEAGFTDLGLFIETSLLGSKFENGELQEEIAEMDMVKLQGVCSHGEVFLAVHWLIGLLVNVAFPSFLGDKRDIDLIIAPEFTAGNMFENLTLARDYAAKLKKPFPEIDEKILEERDWPKDCYVFEGKEKEPTIVFMPLFNRNNCKDAEEVKAKMAEFSTFQHSYSQEKVELLLETGKENMKRNKQTLLREIKKAAGRRRCRKSARQRFSESCLFGLV